MLSLYREPAVQRHLIPDAPGVVLTPEQEEAEMRRWVGEDAVYGIFNKAELAGIGFFYPYEDRDVPQMVNDGLVPEGLVPKTNKGKVDYKKVVEASLLVSGKTREDTAGEGMKKALEAFRLEKGLTDDLLVMYFRLQNEEDSVAGTDSGSVFKEELDREGRILVKAGFIKTGDVEDGAVGVFVKKKS